MLTVLVYIILYRCVNIISQQTTTQYSGNIFVCRVGSQHISHLADYHEVLHTRFTAQRKLLNRKDTRTVTLNE